MKLRDFLYTILLSLTILASCKKEDTFLAAKPNEKLTTLNSLSDLNGLLADEDIMNRNMPGLGELSSDDFYVTTARWNLLGNLGERNALIWGGMPFYNPAYYPNDWYDPYQMVYYANTVLEALPAMTVTSDQIAQAAAIKGSALFFRSLAFYELLETFSLPYDSLKSGSQLGIPLRLSTDINTAYPRSSQQVCYDQAISDLTVALPALPDRPDLVTHASRAAAYGLLSRIYLSTDNYTAALDAANKALTINNSLTDYNSLPNTTYKLTSSNDYLSEDIFHSALTPYSSLFFTNAIVDSTLYRTYDDNDLRKSLFFFTYKGNIAFKGSYEVMRYYIMYSGIATDEIYLTRAECEARTGDVPSAISDLNALLVKRYTTGTFVPHTAVSQEDALQQILLERRKELLFRGVRWKDLRRLNREPYHATTLHRVINNTMYTLAPGDIRYALPIPDQDITLGHLQQNPR